MRVKRVLLLASLAVLLSGCASLSSLSVVGADELPRRTSLPTSGGNAVRVLSTGEEFYSALLGELSGAKEYVCMEYYTIENDRAGRALMDTLASCARRGVQAYLIYDSYGSTRVKNPCTKAFFKQYSDRGVHIAAFNPNVGSVPRDHRKLTVIDGKSAYIGGMNWTEENICGEHGAWATRDLSFRLEGPAVDDLGACFWRIWDSLSEERPPTGKGVHAGPEEGSGPGARVTVADTYGDQASPTPEQLFVSLIGTAGSEIRIVNAYFLPSAPVRQALVEAARRGVAVTILMGDKTDLPAPFTREPLNIARRLARQDNISLNLVPGVFYHAKAMSIDGHTLMAGSCNLDFLSLRANLELDIIVRDTTVASDFDRLFDNQH